MPTNEPRPKGCPLHSPRESRESTKNRHDWHRLVKWFCTVEAADSQTNQIDAEP